MGNPVVHFEVVGADGKALRSFFGDLFGWKIEQVAADGIDYGMISTDDAGIAGGVGASPPGTPGHVTFYVQVPDLDAALQKAESLGGKTVAPPMEIGEGTTIAMFADPEGHVVGLVKG